MLGRVEGRLDGPHQNKDGCVNPVKSRTQPSSSTSGPVESVSSTPGRGLVWPGRVSRWCHSPDYSLRSWPRQYLGG